MLSGYGVSAMQQATFYWYQIRKENEELMLTAKLFMVQIVNRKSSSKLQLYKLSSADNEKGQQSHILKFQSQQERRPNNQREQNDCHISRQDGGHVSRPSSCTSNSQTDHG